MKEAFDMAKSSLVPVVRKPVVGFEGYYEVDQFGRVFGVDRTVSVNDNGRVYDKPLVGKQMKQSTTRPDPIGTEERSYDLRRRHAAGAA